MDTLPAVKPGHRPARAVAKETPSVFLRHVPEGAGSLWISRGIWFLCRVVDFSSTLISRNDGDSLFKIDHY